MLLLFFRINILIYVVSLSVYSYIKYHVYIKRTYTMNKHVMIGGEHVVATTDSVSHSHAHVLTYSCVRTCNRL